MLNKFVYVFLLLLITSPVQAFTYDGMDINFEGDGMVISREEGTMEVNKDAIKVDGEDGSAVVTEDDIKLYGADGEEMVVTEDAIKVTGNNEFVVTEDSIEVDNGTDFSAIVIEGENGIKIEDEGAESSLSLVKIEEDKVLLSDGNDEYMVQVGVTGIKVSDDDSTVVVYYGDSGIETSNILVGDKTGTIYLGTDFGEKRIGAMPNKMVKQLKFARGLDPTNLEFGWDLEGNQLFYVIEAQKVENFLWWIPTTIQEVNYYSTESGVLMRTDRSAWHTFMDWLSF